VVGSVRSQVKPTSKAWGAALSVGSTRRCWGFSRDVILGVLEAVWG